MQKLPGTGTGKPSQGSLPTSQNTAGASRKLSDEALIPSTIPFRIVEKSEGLFVLRNDRYGFTKLCLKEPGHWIVEYSHDDLPGQAFHCWHDAREAYLLLASL